ncbi:MAG: alpha/beta hydrolase [Myxococcales bacterium]|nr:alpha/beta hydrolase [Myxococcales bacterium]
MEYREDALNPRVLENRHGAKVSYVVLGEGPRTLMLANGLGGRLYTWEPLVRALPAGYRVISWDYRGLFDSTPPTGRRWMSVDEHAADALAILDAEGIDRAVFCGWSMGVQVSLEATVQAPERVAGLVLLNGTYGHVFSSGLQPAVRLPFAGQYLHALVEYVADHPTVARAIGHLAPHFMHPAVAFFWLVSGTRPSAMQPLLARYLREVFGDTTFSNYLRLFQELDAHSVLHHLREITAPALVVSGGWDWLTPAYQSARIAERLPHAEYMALTRASHFVLLERPETVIPAVMRFFDGRARW